MYILEVVNIKYIKAKYQNSNRTYTYRTEDTVSAGDTVVTDKGVKLTVMDEAVDMAWVEAYGADKVAIVKKLEESAEESTGSNVVLDDFLKNSRR